MSTLREIHERCKTRHFVDPDWKIQTGGSVCARCHRLWPCDDYADAVAALAILDEAGKYPQPLVHSEGYLQTAAGHYAYRLVPDPPVAS